MIFIILYVKVCLLLTLIRKCLQMYASGGLYIQNIKIGLHQVLQTVGTRGNGSWLIGKVSLFILRIHVRTQKKGHSCDYFIFFAQYFICCTLYT